MYIALVVLGVLCAVYLYVAVVSALVLIFLVVRDMWGHWPELTILHWGAIPFLFLYYGLRQGILWPRLVWDDHKRTRRIHADIQESARRLGVA